MTPEERTALAVSRLDAFLQAYDRLEDPIETALDDVAGFAEEMGLLMADGKHGRGCRDCPAGETCLQRAWFGLQGQLRQLRELWDTREAS